MMMNWFSPDTEKGIRSLIGIKQDLFTSFVPLQREQQQLKNAASKKETPVSPKAVGTPQDKAQIEHLKQACQERDGTNTATRTRTG